MTLLFLLPLFFARGLADVDWDVVLSIAFGIGAAAYAVLEHRRTTKLDGVADDLLQRLSAVEAVAAHRDDVVALGERVAALAVPPDLTALGERLAAVTDRQVTHAERIAVLEARADHQPWKHTRRKDGKFARSDETTTTE